MKKTFTPPITINTRITMSVVVKISVQVVMKITGTELDKKHSTHGEVEVFAQIAFKVG